MPKMNQFAQLREVAEANGWKIVLDNYYSYWSYAFFRGEEHVSIRTGKKDQVIAVSIFSDGVYFQPRTGKFREVCIALSAKKS